MSKFVAPTGYVELDNDCEYSIDLKSTRSREEVNPKEDLAFYFNTYIVPKYGLNNINALNSRKVPINKVHALFRPQFGRKKLFCGIESMDSKIIFL